MKRWIGPAGLGLLGLALLVAPFGSHGSALRILTTMCSFAVMAQAWNLMVLAGGYVDFGSVGFFGLGGYGTAVLMARGNAPFFLAIPEAALIAGMLAVLIGLLTLRLPRLYFSLVTLGLPAALYEMASHWPSLTGGAGGLSLPAPNLSGQTAYYLTLALMAMVLGLTWWLDRSPRTEKRWPGDHGQPFVEWPYTTTIVQRLGIYLAAALLMGLIGGCTASSLAFVDPGGFFNVGIGVEIILMVLLGGAGTVWGPLFGAAVITALSETLNDYAPGLHLTLLGALLVAVALLLPGGATRLFKRLFGPAAEAPSGGPTAHQDAVVRLEP